MFCKWCGLESETTDVCSWCSSPFQAAATTPESDAKGSIQTTPSLSPAAEKESVRTSAQSSIITSHQPIVPAPIVPFPAPRTATSLPSVDAPPRPSAPLASLAMPDLPPVPSRSPLLRLSVEPEEDDEAEPAIGALSPVLAAPEVVVPIRNLPIPAPAPLVASAPPVGAPIQPIPIRGKSLGATPPAVIPIIKRPAPGVHTSPAPEPARIPVIDAPPMSPAPPQPLSGPVGVKPSVQLMPLGGGDGHEDEDEAPRIGGAPTAPKPGLVPGQRPSPVNLGGIGAKVAATVVPERGGRTWFCGWCGMDSDSPENCSWCRRSLRTVPTGSGGVKIHTNKPLPSNKGKSAPTHYPSKSVRTAAPVKLSPAPVAAPQTVPSLPLNKGGKTNPTVAGPQLGTFRAENSKYYSDKVYDPVSGMHFDADTGKIDPDLPETKIVLEETSEIKQLGFYLLAFVPILLIPAYAASIVPGSYLWALGISTFLAAILLPIFRVAPFASDDSEDLALGGVLILIFGPFVGGIIFGVISIIRGSANPTMVGIIVTSILLRIGIDYGVGNPIVELFSKMMPDLNFANFAARWMPLVGIVGWLSADPFKKPDE